MESAQAPVARLGFGRAVFAALGRASGLVLAWVALFCILRLVLVAATWNLRGDATPGLLAEAALRGLRFDLSTAVKCVALFSVWLCLRPNPGKTERRAAALLHAGAAAICIFSLVSEIEFYKEFQLRLGPLAFEYFSTKSEHNQIVFSMIWDGYPVIRWTLVVAAVLGAFVWTCGRYFFRGRARAAEPTAAGAVAALVFIALGIVAHRGGLQSSVLRWGDAVFSKSTYANHMVENGVFALMDAALDMGAEREVIEAWKGAMPADAALEEVRRNVLLPGETLESPERFPLLRRSRPSSIAARRPKNVVMIVMESFTARLCDATGAPFGATPRYAELAKEGILFDHAFSVGTHTAQGIFSTLCSFPPLPGYESLMKHTRGQQPMRSLPAMLKEKGFQTLFLYNGLFSWDNKEGFFRKQGIDRFIGLGDIPNPTFVDPVWGYCDEDVFRRAVDEFDAMARAPQPFLGVVLTLSNHAPFHLPNIDTLRPIENGGAQSDRLRGVQYADYALGKFFDAARTKRWFADTLFVLTGDHGFGIPPVLTPVNLLHMHVPMMFLAPGMLKPEVRHTVASQLDLVPSVLGILGVDVVHQSFGRDLFSLPAGDPGQAFVKQNGDPWVGWVRGDEVEVLALKNAPRTFRYSLAFPPSATPVERIDGDHPEAPGRRVRAFVSTAVRAVDDRLLAPAR